MKRYPIESVSQKIGRLGDRAFKYQTPENWICSAMEHVGDFGIDYTVQIVEDGFVKYHFLVQLKTTTALRFSEKKQCVSIPINISTLNYYRNISTPLLILLCDMTNHAHEPEQAPIYFIWAHKALEYFNDEDKKTDTCSIFISIKNKYHRNIDVTKMIKEVSAIFYESLKITGKVNINYQKDHFDFKNYLTETNYIISTGFVYVDVKLPTIQKPAGACLIMFSFATARDCMITFNHKDIMNTLFYGLYTEFSKNIRRFIIGSCIEDGIESRVIQLGNTTLILPNKFVHELCATLDTVAVEYLKRLRNIEQIFKSRYFQISKDGESFQLLEITKGLWYLMINFANEFTTHTGDSEWHQFVNGSTTIRIFQRNAQTHQATLVSLRGNTYFQNYNENKIIIGWQIPSDYSNEFSNEDALWDVEFTYTWLTEKFIPYVIYYYEVEKNRSIFKRKKFKNFNEFSKNLQLEMILQSKKYIDLHPLDQANSREQLLKIVNQMQSYTCLYLSWPISHNKKNIQEIYLSLNLCLAHVSLPSIHYLIKNLDAINVNNQKDLMDWIRNTANIYPKKLNNNKIDVLLRCLAYVLESEYGKLDGSIIEYVKQSIAWIWDSIDLFFLIERNSYYKFS